MTTEVWVSGQPGWVRTTAIRGRTGRPPIVNHLRPAFGPVSRPRINVAHREGSTRLRLPATPARSLEPRPAGQTWITLLGTTVRIQSAATGPTCRPRLTGRIARAAVPRCGSGAGPAPSTAARAGLPRGKNAFTKTFATTATARGCGPRASRVPTGCTSGPASRWAGRQTWPSLTSGSGIATCAASKGQRIEP